MDVYYRSYASIFGTRTNPDKKVIEFQCHCANAVSISENSHIELRPTTHTYMSLESTRVVEHLDSAPEQDRNDCCSPSVGESTNLQGSE